ncbi:MAG: hypothetical protein EBS59_00005, partial [Verrucomicrobia bacterium]|nr:hypothetical protein [Verrucomicrobiota bacterium]
MLGPKMVLICMTRLILFLVMGLTSFLHAEDNAAGSNQGDQEDVPSSTQLSSEQIMQKEIDRRRETTFRWNEMLDLGERLYQAGEWKHGEAKYRLVLRETDGQSFSAGFYRRAQIGVAKCLAAEALAKKEEGKPSEAAVLMKQAEDMDPHNPALAKQSATLLEQSTLSDNPFASNPAVTEELMTKTTEIKKLL